MFEEVYIFLKKRIWKRIKGIIVRFIRFVPINNNKVIFDNFGGRGFGDDPKYIALELLKRNEGLNLIWVTSDPERIELPEGIKPVKYGTIRAAYHWASASVWVDNIKNAIKPEKKNEQYYIQTWHSTLGFKRNEQDAEHLPEQYVIQAKKDAERTDLMYSNNNFRFDKYKNRFWYMGEVIKCDVPRMGILISPGSEITSKVYRYFSIPRDRKIVLYAPTFRKKTNVSSYLFDYERCKDVLSQKYGQRFEFMIRLHPNDARNRDQLSGMEGIYDGTMYPDMQELLATAAVLITDYSGCMFDFGFTRKPVFLFAKDLDTYLAEERKCYFSLDEVPFDLYQSEEALFRGIQTFDQQEYEDKCGKFELRVGFHDTGHGAEQIADIILEHLHEKDT